MTNKLKFPALWKKTAMWVKSLTHRTEKGSKASARLQRVLTDIIFEVCRKNISFNFQHKENLIPLRHQILLHKGGTDHYRNK